MMFGIVKIVYYRSMSSMCLSKGRHCTFKSFQRIEAFLQSTAVSSLGDPLRCHNNYLVLEVIASISDGFYTQMQEGKSSTHLGKPSKQCQPSQSGILTMDISSGLARAHMQFDFRLTVSCLLSHKLWSRDWQHGFLESLCRHPPPLLSPTGQPPLSSQCLTLAKACSE